MVEWANLTTCFGGGSQNPTEQQLMFALKELFQSKDDEHPEAWVECGSESGPLYLLSVFSSGYAIYTKYSDVDMSEELETKRIENVNQEKGLQLWKSLINSNLSEI